MKRDILLLTTISYLLIPCVTFFIGWLRPEISIVILCLLFITCILEYKTFSFNITNKFSIFQIVVMGIIAFTLTYHSGSGGFQFQESDYFKHNLVIHDLLVNPWPVVYNNSTYEFPILCYYVAYYLPIALLGKFGISVELIALFWTATGLWLGLLWLFRITKSWLGLIGLWLLEGIDYLYDVVRYLGTRSGYKMNFSKDEAAINHSALDQYLLKYSNNPEIVLKTSKHELILNYEMLWTQLSFVPQHLLPALLGLGLLWKRIKERSSHDIIFLMSLLLLWSPFTAIGLLPFVGYLVWKSKRIDLFSWVNVCGIVITFIIISFYQAHLPQEYVGIIFSFLNDRSDVIYYVTFLSLKIVFLFLCYNYFKRTEELYFEWIPMQVLVIWLLSLTLIYVGYYNDWLTRVSLPAAIAFHSNILITWDKGIKYYKSNKNKVAFWLLSCVITLSMLSPLKNFLFLIYGRIIHQSYVLNTSSINDPFAYGADLSHFKGRNLTETAWGVERQYLGKRNSFFVQYLMKKEFEKK